MAMALLAPCWAPGGSSTGIAGSHFRGIHLHFRVSVGRASRFLNYSQVSCNCAGGGSDASLAREVESRVVAEETVVQNESSTEGRILSGADVSSILEWEIDFCSRPIFDDRGKKLWELIVCDGKRQLEFSRFYRSNVINSVTLKRALADIIETFGLPKPIKVRFFRSQVQTIITKACAELDIEAIPTQRCITLIKWLQERYEPVYRQHPGFREGVPPLTIPEVTLLKPLPQNLRGDKWAFVQLPFKALQEEITLVEKKSTSFGNVSLEIEMELPSPDTLISGVAVASNRSVPLAAWTQSLELVSLDVDLEKSCLVLSTGVSDQWLYASYRKNKQADNEAEAWEAAKEACGGLHFLAIQPSLESDSCSGLWLLYNLPTSPV